MDTRSPEQRRRIMQSVGRKDTGAEVAVRRLLHRLGYRYRLHVGTLPGKPDIAFAPRRRVVFVHGCFWHGHGCKKGQLPKSNQAYWQPKIESNKSRDASVQARLEADGWRVLTVWECQTKDDIGLSAELSSFLGAPKFRSTPETMSAKLSRQRAGAS